MSTDFYRKVFRAGSHVVKDVAREPAIRAYKDSPDCWTLQVRGPQMLGMGYTEGKAMMVASAKLLRDDLVALRDALNALIAEEDSQ